MIRNRECEFPPLAVKFNRLHRTLARYRFGDSEAAPFMIHRPYVHRSQKERDLLYIGREIRATRCLGSGWAKGKVLDSMVQRIMVKLRWGMR